MSDSAEFQKVTIIFEGERERLTYEFPKSSNVDIWLRAIGEPVSFGIARSVFLPPDKYQVSLDFEVLRGRGSDEVWTLKKEEAS